MGHILKGQVRYTLAVEDVIQQGEIPTDLQGISPLAFTSGVSASFDENIDADSTVYTVAAEKPDGTTTGITYGISGTDAGDFTINANTGVITIDASPNFEADPSYSIIVTANHANFDAITRNVALAVNNLDEVAPTITSGATTTAIAENSGAGQVIYTATADDSSDVSGGVTFALASTAPDNSAFTINATTGEVTLTANPDYETKSNYIFGVQATDAVGNQSSIQGVSLTITNTNDNAPVITSGGVATSIAENSGANQVVYQVSSTDADGSGSWNSIGEITLSGTDASSFSVSNNIYSDYGQVTLLDNPNFETKPSYTFDVTVTDDFGNGNASAPQTVTLAITNVDDTAPVFTSSSSTIYLAQGIDANEEVYTAVATDTGDGTNGNITYSLTDNAGGRFTIDSSTGVVTNVTPPASGSAWTAGSGQAITIRATDDAGNFADRTQSFFAASAPGFGSGNAGVTVPESQARYSPPGSGLQASHIFHTIDMTDAESLFDFYLIDSNGNETSGTGGFHIVSDGSASLGGGLYKTTNDPAYDHETTPSYSITVRARRKDSPLVYATTTFSVTVLDTGISFPNGTTSKTIAENSGAGQLIYQPFAGVSDPQYDTSDLTYVLSGADASHFTVQQHQSGQQSLDGSVYLTADPDYETKSSYAVTLTANGPGSPPADTLSVNLTVTITDVAESALLETFDLGSTNVNLFGSLYEGGGFTYYYYGSIDGVSGRNPSNAPSAVNLLVSSAQSTYPGAQINEIRQIVPSSGTNHNTMISITTPQSQGNIGSSNFAWNRMDTKANGSSTVLNTLNKSSMSYSQSSGSPNYHRFSWTSDTTRRFTDSDSTFATETDYDIEFHS